MGRPYLIILSNQHFQRFEFYKKCFIRIQRANTRVVKAWILKIENIFLVVTL
jgi:hypothetical protein